MSVDLENLAKALEQTRHHLKVLGAKVDPDDDNEEELLRILKDIYSSLLAVKSKSKKPIMWCSEEAKIVKPEEAKMASEEHSIRV